MFYFPEYLWLTKNTHGNASMPLLQELYLFLTFLKTMYFAFLTAIGTSDKFERCERYGTTDKIGTYSRKVAEKDRSGRARPGMVARSEMKKVFPQGRILTVNKRLVSTHHPAKSFLFVPHLAQRNKNVIFHICRAVEHRHKKITDFSYRSSGHSPERTAIALARSSANPIPE